MNSICIIGDSHIGALKLAYEEEKKILIDIYGIGASKFLSLYIKGKNILTENIKAKQAIKLTNGDEFIPLDKYNYVLIYGGQILSGAQGYDWLRYYSSALSKRYSENCLRQACIDLLNSAFGFKLAKEIKKSNLCEKVTIVPSPLPSEANPFVNHKLLSSSTPASAQAILAKVELIYENYLGEYGINLIWNPPELLSKNGFTTDIKYKVSLEEDVSHINVPGAKIILNNIYGYLAR